MRPNPAEQSGKSRPQKWAGSHHTPTERRGGGVCPEKQAVHQQGGICEPGQFDLHGNGGIFDPAFRQIRPPAGRSPVAALAGEVIDHTEKANSIFPKGAPSLELRKGHPAGGTGRAYGPGRAPGTLLHHPGIEPAGVLTKPDGKSIPPAEATKKLDDMAQSLGEKIDRENELIRAVIESDRKRK